MHDTFTITRLSNHELSLKITNYNPHLKEKDYNAQTLSFDSRELDKLIYHAIANNNTALLAYLLDILTQKADKKIKKHNAMPQLTEWDISAIRDFFKDKKRVKEQLKKLNNQLKALAKKLGIYDEDNHSLKGFNPDLPYRDNKFLSGYFKQWAQENGFSVAFRNGVPTLFKMDAFLSTKEFQDVIREGHLFKDKYQGGEQHGEWTHFIQWWCLVEANKETPFLLVKPHKLLRLLGENDSKVWFDLFEIPFNELPSVGYIYASPFTNVFNFNQYLLSFECALKTPLLHAAIKGRANKRIFEKALPALFSDKRLLKIYPQQKTQNTEKITNISLIKR